MVPGQEIAIRAVGTALAGMSVGIRRFICWPTAGGGRASTASNTWRSSPSRAEARAERLRPRRPARRAAEGDARRRHGDDGFVRRFRRHGRARTAADRDRRGASGSRLAEDRRRAPFGRSRRQRARRRPYRGDCRARRRLGPARRQGRRSARRLKRREWGPALRPRSDLPVIRPRHRRLASSRRARS